MSNIKVNSKLKTRIIKGVEVATEKCIDYILQGTGSTSTMWAQHQAPKDTGEYAKSIKYEITPTKNGKQLRIYSDSPVLKGTDGLTVHAIVVRGVGKRYGGVRDEWVYFRPDSNLNNTAENGKKPQSPSFIYTWGYPANPYWEHTRNYAKGIANVYANRFKKGNVSLETLRRLTGGK